jgi:hypothetical protein
MLAKYKILGNNVSKKSRDNIVTRGTTASIANKAIHVVNVKHQLVLIEVNLGS